MTLPKNQATIDKTKPEDSIEIHERKIKNYLDNEVLGYAKYVIETRAMPNIMDGLRVGARKILWAAMNGDLKKSSKIKMNSLIGDTLKQHYNHGDASLLNTIIQLCSIHVYKYTPLEALGQIDDLRGKCDTAPRYLHIRKTKYLDFFTYDKELLQLVIDDGDKVEPKYFLPIIPISLLWRTNSPGFGFSYRCFSYDLNGIIDNCIKAINTGTCNNDVDMIQLIPHIVGIKQENIIYNGNKDSWYNVGEYVLNFDADILTITDLPFDISFEKFEEHLQSLVEKNYIIKFTNYSQDGNIKYLISFARGRLKILSNDQWKFFQTMKLFSKIKKDTLNCIDQDGKTMLFFQSPYELIDCFVRKRLIFYQERKTKTVANLKAEIKILEDKIKFIGLVIGEQLVVNNRPINAIKIDLDKNELPHDVLKMNISKLTKDEIQEMTDEIVNKKDYLNYIQNSTIQEMYVRDLVDFKERFSEVKILN